MTSALERLRSDVASAIAPEPRAESLLKLALCLAQLGKMDEAKSILSQVRGDFSSGRAPRVSIRLLLLEGVISYYDNLHDSSDRLNRALVLAKAIDLRDLYAEVSVWISHLAYNFEKYKVLANSLREVFASFELLDDGLKARACLLVADGSQYLEGSAAASGWYTLARIFSRHAHDHAIIAAIEYNRLGMGLSRIRIERALHRRAGEAMRRQWLLELESVKRLHVGFDVSALSELLDLCDAYTHELLDEFSDAVLSLSAIQRSGAATRCGVSDALLALEIAWCEAKLHGTEPGGFIFSECLDRIEKFDSNERLLALSFIEELNEISEDSVDFDRYMRIRDDATAHYQTTAAELAGALDNIRSNFDVVAKIAGLPSSGVLI